MLKKKWMAISLAMMLVLGSALLIGCGGGSEDGGDEGDAEVPKESTVEFSGVTAPVPDGYYGEAEAPYSFVTVYKADKETVESAESTDDIDLIRVTAYPLNKTPSYAGDKDIPVDYGVMKAGFTEYWAGITGTTPAEEVMVGDIPFMKTETATNGVDSHVMAGVVEGYVVEIDVIGPDFIGSEDAQKILDGIEFDLKTAFESE